MKNTVALEHADIPAAVEVFQRKPLKPLRYGLFRRFGDWLAGRRDRRPELSEPIDTPWIVSLRHEFANRIEQERRNTLAVIAVLDDQESQHQSARSKAMAEIERLEDDLKELSTRSVSDVPTTVSEHLDAPEHRQARRQRALNASKSQLDAQLNAARNAALQETAALQRIETARQSHWTVLLARSYHVIALGNRRVGTYIRSLSRQLKHHVATPSLAAPDWMNQVDVPRRTTPTFESRTNPAVLRAV